MVDRVAQSTTSRIPVPAALASTCLLPNGTDVVASHTRPESSPMDPGAGENGNHNGNHTDELNKLNDHTNPDGPVITKVPKAIAPKDLLIDKGNACLENNDQRFDTFLMTGEMMIKTNPSLKLQKADGSCIERHHSESASHDSEERVVFKRSASTPDQSTLTAAIRISHENLTMDNISHALDSNVDDAFIIRKESAESGFEEQAVHSDSGVSEKKDKIANDPTSVSDLSEVDSDDFLGNLVSSQTSTKCGNVSTGSTPSDLRSEVSVNNVLLQEVEPLLNDDSSSSSSIDISSSGSCSEDMSPEMIFERSLSDSGGMSPVYQKDVKSMLASKSAEKIVFQRPIKLVNVEHQSVRASKSHENYVGNDVTFVSIDIDDMTYSLDQIPRPVDPTPTKEDKQLLSDGPNTYQVQPPDDAHNNDTVTTHPNDDRIFMPSFVKLSDSVDSTDSVESNNEEDVEYTSECSGSDSAQIPQVDEVSDIGARPDDERVIADIRNHGLDELEPVINQADLFALPPAKCVDQPSAKRLAKRLFHLDGFRKSDVSRHLSKK